MRSFEVTIVHIVIPEGDQDVNRTSLRRATMPGIVALTLGLGLSACGASNETDSSSSSSTTTSSGEPAADLAGTLNGAGASSQEAAMEAWRAGFQEANPEVTVNYDAVGSGGGREQFLAGGSISFAGSDDYLDDKEMQAAEKRCGGAYTEIPVYISPIAVIYNLPDVDELNLSPENIGAIFAGDITTWNDEAIAADNPDAALPDSEITPVHRSDESGTTGNFTAYLEAAASGSWTYGTVETWPFDGGEGADGTSGVVDAVTNGEGTIGYADASQAGELGKANVGVGSEFVAPAPEAAAAVVDASSQVSGRPETDLATELARDTTESGAYPIVLISYHIACTQYEDAEQAALVKAFETYVISEDGQSAAAETAGSAPMSSSLREKAQAVVDQIQAGS